MKFISNSALSEIFKIKIPILFYNFLTVQDKKSCQEQKVLRKAKNLNQFVVIVHFSYNHEWGKM